MRIRGYFSKLKGVREQKPLRNTIETTVLNPSMCVHGCVRGAYGFVSESR